MKRNPAAFSLVEVVLAIGIVSFALLAVVGLLPAGLKSIKNANEQAGAANVVGAISEALRVATSLDGTNFTTSFAGKPITFAVTAGTGPSPAGLEWRELGLDGSANPMGKRLSARLEILNEPVASPLTPGRAVISVAWPAQADPTWNSANRTWTKAEGFVTTAIQFLPKR